MTQLQPFDIVSPEFHADPHPTLAAMRAAGPVIRMKLPIFGRTWVATSHEACASVLKDQQGFARDPRNAGRRIERIILSLLPRSVALLADNMLGHDDPEHRRLRGLVDEAFARRGIEAMRPEIASIADRLLDRFERMAEADLMAGYCRELPLTVICAMLGFREADHDRFREWLGGLTDTAGFGAVARAVPGVIRAVRYIRSTVRGTIPTAPDGLVAHLREAEIEGRRLSEDERVSMIFLLFGAGQETTTHLIAGGLLALLADDEARRRIAGDPDAMPLAVEECLRHVSPVQTTKPRYVTRDMEFFGVALRRGETVVPMIAAANGDPARFDLPERFDAGRHPNPHLAFGTGVHFCLGFQLARAEAAIAIERLFVRFPAVRLAIDPDRIVWRRRLGIRAMAGLPVRLR